MRWMLAVAAAFVLAGCGSGTPGQAGGAPITPDHPAPPIIAANESPPDEIQSFLDMDFGTDQSSTLGVSEPEYICEQSSPPDGSSTVSTPCPQPNADEIAKLKTEEEQYDEAIKPAAGTSPEVVAKLELGANDELFFTAWTTSSGDACWEVDEERPDGGGGGGPSGPCVAAAEHIAYSGWTAQMPQAECAALCLTSESDDSGDSGTTDFRLEGTVPADAEAIRVTIAGGATATYPLVGPRLSDPGVRVFMADIGDRDWRKVELIRDGMVASTQTMPAGQVAIEDCEASVGPAPTPTFPVTTDPEADVQAWRRLMQPYNDALGTCLKAKGVP